MRRLILFLTLAAAGATATALTPAETNKVLMALSACIQFDGDIGQPRVRQPGDPDVFVTPEFELNSYEELFEDFPTNDVVGTLTAQERREVFEAALWSIPDLPTNRTDRGLHFGGDMLRFCAKHNQTNFLPLAQRILLSPRAQWVPEARDFFEKFAKPSEETNRFVENVITNLLTFPRTAPQLSFISGYKEMLLRWKEETEGAAFSNGVRIIYRSVDGKIGGSVFDLLMVSSFPDYAESSNRLSFAVSVLEADPLTDFYGRILTKCEDDYFTPITNALLNASEPLKVLDLSWLDEPPANNENGQQEENND